VKIYLPRWQGEEDQAPADRVPDQHRRTEGQETILVVEDDDEVRAYAVRVLRERGYHILQADNANTALTIVREQQLDLLFTDIGLPNTDGRQLSRLARQIQPTLKILFTTGYARNAIVHNGTLDADVELIPKPFSSDALSRRVRQILDRPVASGEAP